MENLTTKERLQKFVAEIGYGRNKFEHYVGISSGYLSSKSISITSDVIEKIIDKFPQLNIYWLLTGEGSMLKTAPEESFVSEPQAAYGGDTANLREKIEALELEVKDLKYQREVLKELIDVLKGSISDKDVIIDLLNEKVNTPIFVKEKSTPK